MAIHLKPGKKTKRKALHKRYGGRQQGGISPSAKTPNVFLFTDQARGLEHGYIFDGQRDDGLYDYTGEGQTGDQQMVQGNRAIRDHGIEGRELHLFDADSGTATYLGQYVYVGHRMADAPQRGHPDPRSVIVFRLRPVGTTAEVAPSPLEQLSPVRQKELPVEQHLTERMWVTPKQGPYQATRREQKLVKEFENSLISKGHKVCRLQLWAEGEPAPFVSDLFDSTTRTLVEAKGTVARTAFRMAIGQLIDYGRLAKPTPKLAILLPERPREDLLKLAATQSIEVIWPDGEGGFASSQPTSP